MSSSAIVDSSILKVSPSGDFVSSSNGILFTISVPGKVILHGEHSVVYGKLALAAALGLRTSLSLRENEGTSIEVHFPDLNLHYSFSLEEVQNLLDKSLPTDTGVASFNLERPEHLDHELHLKNIEGFLSETNNYPDLNSAQKNSLTSFLYLLVGVYGSLNIRLRPLHVTVSSQLKLGAGTGSSASFNVSLVAGLMLYLKLASRRDGLDGNLSKDGYAATKLRLGTNRFVFTEEELKIVSSWGFYGEKIQHGTPSGIDNAICTYGSLIAFTKGSPPEIIEMSFPLRLILINTRVSRETKTQVAKAADFMQKYPSISDHLLEAMNEVSKTALTYIKRLKGHSFEDEELGEVFERLGDLSETNHGLLSVFGVSHTTLQEVVDILKRQGLKGKLTGAGGGGYAICLVPPRFGSAHLNRALDNLKSAGYETSLTVLGDVGVRVDI